MRVCLNSTFCGEEDECFIDFFFTVTVDVPSHDTAFKSHLNVVFDISLFSCLNCKS